MKCRNCMDDVRTGDGGRPGISLSGDLKPGSGGIRLEGGVNLDQALAWNAGTYRSDAKGAGQAGDPRETLSTDAERRGRTVKSLPIPTPFSRPIATPHGRWLGLIPVMHRRVSISVE